MGRKGLGSATGRSDASQRFRVAQQSIDPVAANPPGMNSVLVVHLWLGILVAACAALFVWFRLGRRITLYLLSLQILLGIGLMAMGLRVPPPHFVLALVGWAGYMGANYMSRQPDSKQNVLVLTILSSAMVLLAAYIGARAGMPG
jgi:hypothetical protein